MDTMQAPPTIDSRRRPTAHAFPPQQMLSLGLIGFFIGCTFLLDVITPLGIPIWIFYLVPLVFTYQARRPWMPGLVAGICAGLTLVGYFISPPSGDMAWWIPLFNRGLGLGLFFIIAHVVTQQQRISRDRLHAAVLETTHAELVQRESLLLKNTQELRDLYEQAPCGYHSIDENGLLVAINQTELDWLGYTRDEVVDRLPFTALLTAADAEVFRAQLPLFMRDGRIRELEVDLVRKDGTRLPTMLSGTALRDSAGRFVVGRCTLIDITDRRKADEARRLSHDKLEQAVQRQTAELHVAARRLEEELAQSTRTGQALAISERRFRELIECLPQLIWTCRPDGYCDYLSPQWIRYTGIDEPQQLGSGWLEQLHPDDRARTIVRWHEHVDQVGPFDMEFRIRGADGRYQWFQTQAVPLHDEEGRLVKWLGTNTNIDDSRRAQETQARLGAIVESSTDAIVSKTVDGTVLTWNRSAERLYGYQADDIIGRPMAGIIPPERRAEELILFQQCLDGRSLQEYETVRLHKNGTTVPVSISASPIKDAKGAVIGVSTIARDITARKRTEETLAQHHKLLELSYEPIFAWDMANGIVEWNRGSEQLYGYSKSDALGQDSRSLLRTRFPCSIDVVCAALHDTGEWTGELRQRTKDGQEVVVESRLSLLIVDGRRLVLETNRDVTARRRFETMIVKKNHDLETLLHVTSHDLKEPLRAIESFSRMVQDRYADRLDDKGRDFLRRIIRATQRLDQLLTDILSLSRAQRMETPTGEIEADALVQDVLRRLETRIKDTGARITVQTPLPRIRANGTWATQGIYNLVSNALKFTHEGRSPEIDIEPYYGPDTDGTPLVGLVVRDRGPGVPPAQQERIFELFRRAVGREIEGTGAGLAIVRQVAERHGGRAWVAPRPDGGAEFYLTFAATQPLPMEVSR